MSRARDLVEDAGAVLLVFFGYKAWLAFKDATTMTPWWKPEYTDKGGREAGPEATTIPVPQGSTSLWSEATMRRFAAEMFSAGIDARLVLLGIAASSAFNADESLGNNTGLLLLRRDHLKLVGYDDDAHPFEELTAPEQIPWIGKVLSYLISDRGGHPPTTIEDLASLIHPSANAIVDAVIRAEAKKRAADASGTMLFISYDNLLRHVLATPEQS